MADPLRLLRNTSFDKRQIAAWMDSALLVTSLPEGWRALEAQGVTGVIDLAWYASRPASPDASGISVDKLAQACKLESAMLRDLCERLWQDSQVRLVWLLYQFEDGLDGSPAAERASVASPDAAPVPPDATMREAPPPSHSGSTHRGP